MSRWKIAAVQMDCRLGDVAANRDTILGKMVEANRQAARLTVFPECALTGYAFDSLAEAIPVAEPIPGPTTPALAKACAELNLWVVVGMLERDGERVFNAAVLVGPSGFVAKYRKIHQISRSRCSTSAG